MMGATDGAGDRRSFTRGDHYHIPARVKHSAKIHAGYADVSFFGEPDRYGVREAT